MRHSAILLTATVLLMPLPGSAADLFYANLLRSGESYQLAGDLASAEDVLRIACFGLLDEPPLLARCLTTLAVVQDGVGDEAGFRTTFDRLVEVEERFGGFSAAELPEAVRTSFEAALPRRLPRSALERVPVFAELLPSEHDRLYGMSTPDRRRELERLIAAEPRDSAWPTMLGDLELAAGRGKRARRHYELALQIEPASPGANVGMAAIAKAHGKWDEAASYLEASGAWATDPVVAVGLVEALIEARQPQLALETVVELPSELQADDRVEAARLRAENLVAVSAAAASAAESLGAAAGEAERPADPGATAVSDPLSLQDGEEVELADGGQPFDADPQADPGVLVVGDPTLPQDGEEVELADGGQLSDESSWNTDAADDLLGAPTDPPALSEDLEGEARVDATPVFAGSEPTPTVEMPAPAVDEPASWQAESASTDDDPAFIDDSGDADDADDADDEVEGGDARVTALEPEPSPTAAPLSAQGAAPEFVETSAERSSPRFLNLVDLDVQSTRGRTVVTVTADGPIPIDRIRHSRLTNPPRHLIRVVGGVSFSWPYEVAVGDGRLRSVRSAVHPELDPSEVHLVIDRASDGIAVTSVRVSGRVLLVEVE